MKPIRQAGKRTDQGYVVLRDNTPEDYRYTSAGHEIRNKFVRSQEILSCVRCCSSGGTGRLRGRLFDLLHKVLTPPRVSPGDLYPLLRNASPLLEPLPLFFHLKKYEEKKHKKFRLLVIPHPVCVK